MVPEDVEVPASAPRAHYAKAFVHCLSFPRHCAFQLHTRTTRDSCALSTCSLLVFFFLPRPLVLPFSFSFCPRRVLAVYRYLPRTHESFLFFSPFDFALCVNESTRGLLDVSFPDARFPDSYPPVNIDQRSALTRSTIANLQAIASIQGVIGARARRISRGITVGEFKVLTGITTRTDNTRLK